MDKMKNLISAIRNVYPEQLAKDICSVQPMPGDIFKKLYENSKSREELIAEGYKPVSRFGLMWIKDEKEIDYASKKK